MPEIRVKTDQDQLHSQQQQHDQHPCPGGPDAFLIEIGTTELVNIMRSHTERLLEHAEDLGIASDRVALLYGNLAGSYRVLGD